MVLLCNNIAKNIKSMYNDCNVAEGSDNMKRAYLSVFETRQEMQSDDYEIFHRIDTQLANMAPHSHDFYELYCPLSDGISMISAGKRYALSPGMLLLIAPGELHRPELSHPDRPFERIVLWIRPDYIVALAESVPVLRQTLMADAAGHRALTPDEDAYGAIQGLLFSLLREKQTDDAESPDLERLMIAQLMVLLHRCFSRSQEPMPARIRQRDDGILRVYEYIDAHLADNLTVAGLAEQFFMDKNTLTRQFKRVTGLTPGECIRQRRLEAAHAMIAAGSGMQEACAECGFSDYSAFYRAFRQAYGVGPKAFAAQLDKS